MSRTRYSSVSSTIRAYSGSPVACHASV
jgi:hypothetical protein